MPPESLAPLNSALTGRYAIDREIGAGGMATVYLARDLRHERRVALKVLNPELGAVLGVERFLSEIRVTANLQHPNLLPLFDSGEAGGLLFYVMPYVEGETLRHRIDREKQLPIDEAIRIAVAVASALDYAHRHGVIHRDLKPENILMHEGQPLVADFGIALAISNAGGQRVTQTGLSLGTPRYMSPEQATGDRVIDARTDIYSLSAVLYEMLAGEPPHSGTSAQAIIAKLMTTAPQSVRTLRPSVPQNVAMAVECGLAKLPADRFPSAKALADALSNSSFTIAGSVADAALPAKRGRTTEVALAATCVALLAVAVAGWLRPSPSAPVVRYAMALDTTEAVFGGGRWGRLAISPDGSTIVYVGGPQNGLMLRRRDALHATMIPGTEAAGSGPAFSPDGSRIAFIQNASALKIVALDGTPPATVCDSVFGLAGLTWSTDGKIYSDGIGPTPLVRFPATVNARPERFVALDSAAGERDEVYPETISDKALLYTASLTVGTQTRNAIVALDLATNKRHVVVENALRARYVDPGFLIYATSNGSIVAAPFDKSTLKVTGDAVALGVGNSQVFANVDLAVSRSGTLVYLAGADDPIGQRTLVWLGRDGKQTPVDSTWRGAFIEPAISRDGTRIAISTGANAAGFESDQGDIWVRRLDRGSRTRLTVEGGVNRYPVWSADGRSIFYTSSTAARHAVLERVAEGGTPPVVRLSGSELPTWLSVSPDGKWIVAQHGSRGAAAYLIVAQLGVDSAFHPLFSDKSISRMPALSPDGKWLAYSAGEAGNPQTYVVPFPNVTERKWIVSRDGGQVPTWSPRGDELFFRNSTSLMAVPIATNPTFAAGEPKALFPLTGAMVRFAVSPDGSKFLFARGSGNASAERISVIENWPQLMKPTK